MSYSDQNDESLRKWKESLGLGSGNVISDPNDSRTVIILSLGLEVSAHTHVILALNDTEALQRSRVVPTLSSIFLHLAPLII